MLKEKTQEPIIDLSDVSEENRQELTSELSALLEENANEIRSHWVKEMRRSGLLASLSTKEIEEQSRAIYDTCILCLKTGSYQGAENYAGNMAKKAVLETMTVDQIISGLLILRDVYGRFIFQWYHKNPAKYEEVVHTYEPVARRILNIVALAFVTERESVIKQQEAVTRLSTPLVDVWEGTIMIPLIGILDSARAKQLTEAVLEQIAKTKTDVIVMDISGIAAIDTKAASHILRTMQAAKLMGTEIIMTGIRPDVATTLVTLGIDLSNVVTRGTMREGLEFAYSRQGWKVTKV
jgi:rsbT co-antagonist protein RsbR